MELQCGLLDDLLSTYIKGVNMHRNLGRRNLGREKNARGPYVAVLPMIKETFKLEHIARKTQY
jgi:hypothetical protein